MQYNFRIIYILLFILFSGLLHAKEVTITNYLETPVKQDIPSFQAENKIIKNIIQLHHQNNGSTYNIRWGNLKKQNLYVVSLYPELSQIIQGKVLKKEQVREFIEKNIELLLNPQCVVGTWYNTKNKKTYIDVSAVYIDKNKAIKIAKQYNQIAIWDLGKEKEIITGGDGTAIINSPNIKFRLIN